MQDIILKPQLDIAENVYKSPIIKNGFSNKFLSMSRSVLNELAFAITSSKNLIDINPEHIYVAKFPKDILQKLKTGEYKIMKSKSGDLLSNVIDKNLPANKNIVHNIRLKELNLNRMQNLANNMMSMAMQQQLAEISEELADIKAITVSIKRGQILDRIGFILSGRQQLEVALQASKKNRDDLLNHAIQSLSIGRSQLELAMGDEVKNCVNVPKGYFSCLWKSFIDHKFIENCETTYNDIQEYIPAYLDASLLLSYAYVEVGEHQALSHILGPTKIIIQKCADTMQSLNKIVVKNNNNNIFWYNNIPEISSIIDDYSNKALLDTTEIISIEFKGEDFIRRA
jgi:hypothetical protein